MGAGAACVGRESRILSSAQQRVGVGQGISTHELELEETREAVARMEREYDLLEEQVRAASLHVVRPGCVATLALSV